MAVAEHDEEPRSLLDFARILSGLEFANFRFGDPSDSQSGKLGLSGLNLSGLMTSGLMSKGPQVALVLVAQAYVAWIASGFGLFVRAGMSWAAYGAVLAEQLATIGLELGGDGEKRDTAIRTLLDESVAQLRELGELSVQEARTLQHNLLELAKQLRDLDDDTLEEPHRYGKAKI